MARQDYDILTRKLAEAGGEFRERVHVPMTLDTRKVAFGYFDGQADMKGHSADMQVVHLESESVAILSLNDFRKIGRRGKEVGAPLKLGAISVRYSEPFPEPAEQLDGYALVLSSSGQEELTGLAGDDRFIPLEGIDATQTCLIVNGFLEAIDHHLMARKHRQLAHGIV